MTEAGLEALNKKRDALESDLARIIEARMREFRRQTGVAPTAVDVELERTFIRDGGYSEYRVARVIVMLPDDHLRPGQAAAKITMF